MKVAVVGGGITGLAAAWELRSDAEVTVLEAASVGGRVRTTDFEGVAVDEGPDAFITRAPAALQLCAELGLADELVSPAAGRTLLWVGGKLRPLPEGLVLGVPGRLGPVLRSGLLSPTGALRAGLDLVLPPTPIGEDVGVGELVAARFGHEVATRLVEPLLGSIHATTIDGLSASATAPQLLAAARAGRSLLLALGRQGGTTRSGEPTATGGRAATGGRPALFLAPRTGMGRMVERLREELVAAGASIESVRAGRIGPAPDGRISVEGAGTFDGVVLAIPARDAASALGPLSPPGLTRITATSVTLVTLAWDEADLTVAPGVNGVLVPPGEGRLMTACSMGSSKWPHWRLPGRQVLRVSVGRRGDRRAEGLGDTELVDRLAAELRDALGARGEPSAARVSRWSEAFPHYAVGHPGLVAGIRANLAHRLPGVALAGSSYDGAGVPACITSGRAAAS